MEEETNDGGNKVNITVDKWVLVVAGVVVALGTGFGTGYLVLGQEPAPSASIASSSTTPAVATLPTQRGTGADSPGTVQSIAGVPSAYLAQPVSADEMFSEFICSCCGKLIGDCTCGMAGERRGFVTGAASAGQNRLDVYRAYAGQYGLDTLASDEVRMVVRDYKLANAREQRPQIVLESQEIDLGDVSAKEGKVETRISFTNAGQEDLVVDGLSTSCGCTTASVVNDGQEGPVFGAGTSSEVWSTAIRPGETAELRIYYDPSFHGDARGAMMREVSVSSNDPVDPVVKVSIKLNQVD